MDIIVVAKDTLKIKGKQMSIITSPTLFLKTKTSADVLLQLKRNDSLNVAKIEELKLIIAGQGEYELSGTKISSLNAGENIVYSISLDNVSILLSEAEALGKVKDKLDKHDIVVTHVDGKLDEDTLTSFEPRVVLFFGTNAEESAKALGKSVSSISKYATNADRLPEEMDVVVLA